MTNIDHTVNDNQAFMGGDSPVSGRDHPVLGGDDSVAVIGAGIVGLATALGLKKLHNRGLSITIYEQRSASEHSAQADYRWVTINRRSASFLEKLGIWPELKQSSQRFSAVHIYQGNPKLNLGPPTLKIDFDDDRMNDRGPYMVSSKSINSALQRMCCEHAIKFHYGGRVSVKGCDKTAITLDDGACYQLAVIANGASAVGMADEFKGRTSIARRRRAITMNCLHDLPHAGVAVQHFFDGSTFASLPITGNRSSIVWCVPAEEHDRLLNLDKTSFHAEFKTLLGAHLGEVTVERLGSWPLDPYVRDNIVGERMVLVGDAAAKLHPLAGLGLNIGLAGTASLLDATSEAVRLGFDLGSSAALNFYRHRHQAELRTNAAIIDGLDRMLCKENPWLDLVAGSVIRYIDRSQKIKSLFADAADRGILYPSIDHLFPAAESPFAANL